MKITRNNVEQNLYNDYMIYVDSTAVQTGDGTEASPFWTIQEAIDLAESLSYDSEAAFIEFGRNIKIQLAEGTSYPLNSSLKVAGNTGRRLSITGNSLDKPVITSFSEITSSWTRHSGNVYKCNLGNVDISKIQLYKDNERQKLAATSRTPFAMKNFSVSSNTDNGDGTYTIVFNIDLSDITSVASDTQKGRLQLYTHHYGKKYIIGSADPDNNTITVTGPALSYTSGRCVIENFLSLISDHTFVLDDSDPDNVMLYYQLSDGETVTDYVFTYPTLETLLEIGDGSSYTENILISGIKFSGTCFNAGDGFPDTQAGTNNTNAVSLSNCYGIAFQNCETENTGSNAVGIGAASRKINFYHCYLHDIGGTGIWGDTGSDNVKIDNCIIRGCGKEIVSSSGIKALNVYNYTIVHCNIFDISWSGISIGYSFHFENVEMYNNYIGYNHIHHISCGLSDDLGGIYLLGKQTGSVIEYNKIHDVIGYPSYPGSGIYFDHGVRGIKVRYNLVYGTYSGGIKANPSMHNEIYNNIFAFGFVSQIALTYKYKTTSGYYQYVKERFWSFYHNIVVFDTSTLFASSAYNIDGVPVIFHDNNLYYNYSKSKAGISENSDNWMETFDTGSLFRDPLFTNADSGVTIEDLDFSLTEEGKTNIADIDIYSKEPFTDIDLSEAGTTDTDEIWQSCAELGSEYISDFKNMVTENYEEYSSIYD